MSQLPFPPRSWQKDTRNFFSQSPEVCTGTESSVGEVFCFKKINHEINIYCKAPWRCWIMMQLPRKWSAKTHISPRPLPVLSTVKLPKEMTHSAVSGWNLLSDACLLGGLLLKSYRWIFQMLTAMTETPAAVLFGLGPVLKCFFIFPATDSWCSFSGRPSSWRGRKKK